MKSIFCILFFCGIVNQDYGQNISEKLYSINYTPKEDSVDILYFYSTWCGGCIKSLPFIKSFSDSVAENSIRVWCICIQPDTLKWQYIKSVYGPPIVHRATSNPDASKLVLSIVRKVKAYPTIVVISKGKVIFESNYFSKVVSFIRKKRLAVF